MSLEITANLLVTDVARSVRFYIDVLGMQVEMSVGPGQSYAPGELVDAAEFAMLSRDGAKLMLQLAGSLAEDVPGVFRADQAATPSGTLYFRGLSPDEVHGKVDSTAVLVAPRDSWYGMRETYFRDPDGHVLCVGDVVGNG